MSDKAMERRHVFTAEEVGMALILLMKARGEWRFTADPVMMDSEGIHDEVRVRFYQEGDDDEQIK